MILTRLFFSLFVLLTINNVAESGKWSKRISNIFTGINKVDEVIAEIFKIVSNFNGIVGEISQAIQLFNNLGQPDFNDQIKKQHDEVMEKLSHVSNQIDDLSHVVTQSFEMAIKEIINNMEDIDDFTQSTHELSNALETINIYYEKSVKLRKFSNETGINRRTLKDFVDHVFEQSNDVPFMLETVYAILFKPVSLVISKNFLDIFKIYYTKNYDNRCDKSISPHQRLYYIYLSIMTVELKGMLTIAHGYSMRTLLREGSFQTELEEMKTSCVGRMRDYLNNTRIALKFVDRDIRRCDAETHIRDVTFIELEHFSYIKVIDESTLNDACDKNCEDYNFRQFGNTILEKTFYIGGPLKICPAPDESSRDYLWLKLSDKDYYGRYKTCPKEIQEIDNEPVKRIKTRGLGWAEIFYTHPSCDICGSSYYTTHKISIHAQFSDIADNMIVTGVKFVKKNKTIYMQIKQGKLLNEGTVQDNDEWMELKSRNDSDRVLFYNKRTLYLDDVIVPPNYVVTGISFRLNKNKDGFKIAVKGTKYDFTTGILNTELSKWFDSEQDHHHHIQGYYGKRTEIPTNDLDNPIYSKFNKPDRGTNKFVTFTHTCLEKDAGQTTIPFLDAQAVTMSPAMPLNGIGLFYKGAKGFGGYVALRIFTDSMDQYLDISDT